MSKVVIKKNICIEPEYLNENILENIHKKISEKFLNKCDQEHGYIIKIYSKIEIVKNVISNTSSGVFFTVKFGIKCLKPIVGNKYKGVVCMIFSNGIFVEVEEKLKILIPNNKMKKYKYVNDIYTDGKEKIREGVEVYLEIEMIRYEKQNFNCIGKLL